MADVQAPTKAVPIGVKILSILSYIGAFGLIICGVILLVGGGIIGSAIGPMLEAIPFIGSFIGGLLVAAGIIMIGFGVLAIFVGRGLWKGSNWARILVIVLTFLGALMSIISMVAGFDPTIIINIIINLAIGLYLLLSSSVKRAFA